MFNGGKKKMKCSCDIVVGGDLIVYIVFTYYGQLSPKIVHQSSKT